jgi:hypothetical protein
MTLKELLEKRFDHLDELREAEANSLRLQAAEYERRLDALNGEAERIAKVHSQNATRGDLERIERENAELHRKQDATMLPRPEYAAQHDSLAKEFHAAVDLFQAQIGALKEWRAEIIPQLTQLNEIASLKDWKAEQRGKASAASVFVLGIGMVVGWLIGIAGLVHSFTR